MPKNILFLSTLKKGQEMAKWPNHFISGKQFQKRPNLADLVFKKAKWQPCIYLASISLQLGQTVLQYSGETDRIMNESILRLILQKKRRGLNKMHLLIGTSN